MDAAEITRVVRDLCIEINYKVPEEMVRLVKRAREIEESPLGRQVLDLVIRNQELAAEGEYPYCQDTGYTVIFLDLGQDVHVTGTDLYDAVNEGVRQGYGDGYLRGSIVRDPLFDRRNTGDNTPAFIHTRIVPGDQGRIQVDAKGAGSENMGKHAMLKPADGLEGAKEFVLQAVADSGPNACPPGIIGVGIGGNFEMSAVIAKRALMRKVGQPNPDPRVAELEAELYEKCNALGLGPEALGGTQTVLAVHVEAMRHHNPAPRAACHARVPALQIGAVVLGNGTVYAARDAAHKRMVEMLDRGEDLPFAIEGQVVYYVGPTPERPGNVTGSAGPTTASRMDSWTPRLLELGLKGIMGKGGRGPAIRAELEKHTAVYMAALGGGGALSALTVRGQEVIAFKDLQTEAIRRMKLEDF